MEYVDAFRDPGLARAIAGRIRARLATPRTLMEICGGQTHAILRYGIEELAGPALTLVHGPGCPVCVTPLALIDHAIALARTPGVTLCSFGDMLRVPGSSGDLHAARAAGGNVRMIYSPLDAVRLAREDPAREVVLFAVAFETTAPTQRQFSPPRATIWIISRCCRRWCACRPRSTSSWRRPTAASRVSSPLATSVP